jgi:DNA repair protein RadD
MQRLLDVYEGCVIPVLREYQEAALIAGRQHILEGRRRVIFMIPTAGGKGVIAASIIHSARKNFNAKILFLADRVELIDQIVEQLAKWGITEVGVIRSDDKRYAPLMPVQVASVATLMRRELWFTPTIVIHDECHHAVADSWIRIFDQFPDAVHLGFSATPVRNDGKSLGRKYGGPFDAIEIAANYSDLIADGFISEPRCFSSPDKYKPDLSGVHTIDGDYNLDELEEVMAGKALISGLFERWKELHGGRKTIIFATKIRHSQTIVAEFREQGIVAEHLDGSTPLEVRRSILNRFEHGDLQIVSNCQVLTEGVDIPIAKCIVQARPTKSIVFYLQTVGRALRPCCECSHVPNDHDQGACTKCGCLDMKLIVPFILDHAGNFDRHSAPHIDRIWTLDDPPRKSKSAGDFKVCPECYAYIASYMKTCPHCEHSFAKQMEEEEKRLREVNVPLVERTQAVDPKRRDFDSFVDQARKKGYKPTWASVQFKEKYGGWPPWSWSTHAKAMFEADLQWQNKLARNEVWRERRKAEEETTTEEKLIAMADVAFKDWDPVDVALMSPEERAKLQEQLDAAGTSDEGDPF